MQGGALSEEYNLVGKAGLLCFQQGLGGVLGIMYLGPCLLFELAAGNPEGRDASAEGGEDYQGNKAQ